jgi:iron complex transport system substrate-binding protein
MFLALASCAGETTSPAPSAPDTAAAFPVTITHKLGTTVIPAEPTRVVALGGADADVAVALGVRPVAMTGYFNATDGRAPWLAPKLGTAQIEILTGGGENSESEVPLEKVAALRPDLILASQYFGIDAQYDKLSRIAPVIAYQQTQITDSWQDQTMITGRALGRVDQARRVVSEVETKIKQVRDSHPEFQGKTASYSFHFAPDAIQTINSTSDYVAQLLSDLGLRLAPAVTALQGDQGAQISLERIDTLDADVLIMAYASDELRTSLESNPVFRAAPAVRSGHYLPVSVDAISALRLPSVLSIPYGLDQMEPGLAKALD